MPCIDEGMGMKKNTKKRAIDRSLKEEIAQQNQAPNIPKIEFLAMPASKSLVQ